MRHLLAGLVGLLLTAAFAVAAGRGVALTFRPLQVGDLETASRTPGLVWLLTAGVFLGLLVLSRRLSPVAPLIAGIVLLLGTLIGISLPDLLRPGAPGGAAFGVYVLNGYGLGVLFATLLLIVAAVPPGARRAA
ncbi:MAG: hypothetical protein ACT4O0_07795 [Pseudonocardia sp.]